MNVERELAPLPLDLGIEKKAVRSAERLIRLTRQQFWCARAYASWPVPLFPTSREAMLFFRQQIRGDQNELCLARSFFAAKTSQQFKKMGVVVIGVFLPSRSMHAWVMEGDQAADPFDDIWINYQPVALLA